MKYIKKILSITLLAISVISSGYYSCEADGSGSEDYETLGRAAEKSINVAIAKHMSGKSKLDHDVAVARDTKGMEFMLRKPQYPPEPNWAEIGRKDISELSINELIWSMFGDPKIEVERIRNQWLPGLEESYGGHLPEEYINYLDNMILEHMKQMAQKVKEKFSEIGKMEKRMKVMEKIESGVEIVVVAAGILCLIVPICMSIVRRRKRRREKISEEETHEVNKGEKEEQ